MSIVRDSIKSLLKTIFLFRSLISCSTRYREQHSSPNWISDRGITKFACIRMAYRRRLFKPIKVIKNSTDAFWLYRCSFYFQSLTNEVFKKYSHKFILVFFDDILIYSKSWNEHLHVKIIVSILRSHQLYV